MDQVVHHVLRSQAPFGMHERLAVLKNHETAWDAGVVLRGNVDPISVLSPWIGLARQNLRVRDRPLRHAFLSQRIGPKLVEVVQTLTVNAFDGVQCS